MANAYSDYFDSVATDTKDTKDGRYAGVAWYGFSIPSDADIAEIDKLAGSAGILEVGAGLGFWASLLTSDVHASDIRPPTDGETWSYAYGDTKRVDTTTAKYVAPVAMSALEAVTTIRDAGDRTLLVVCPDFSLDFVTEYKGARVIVVQEGTVAGDRTGDRLDEHDIQLKAAGFSRTSAYDKALYWPRYEDRLEIWDRI